MACVIAGQLFQLRRTWGRIAGMFLNAKNGEFGLALMSLFSLAYFLLVIVRSADFDVFDRYLLPILPWAAAILLLWFETENPNYKPLLRFAMPVGWFFLAILGFYAVASTQDLWALAKARVMAARRLESAGVARTAIDGGFEYNAWTQLMMNGRMNSRWVLIPRGAYNPELSQTPVVVPAYRLEYAPAPPETAPSEFGSVPYCSLLPPFHKQVSIDRLLTPQKNHH